MYAYRYLGLFAVYLVDYLPEQFKYRHLVKILIKWLISVDPLFTKILYSAIVSNLENLISQGTKFLLKFKKFTIQRKLIGRFQNPRGFLFYMNIDF